MLLKILSFYRGPAADVYRNYYKNSRHTCQITKFFLAFLRRIRYTDSCPRGGQFVTILS